MGEDDFLEAAYEDRNGGEVDTGEEGFPYELCEPGCHQGSHTEDCGAYDMYYDGGDEEL